MGQFQEASFEALTSVTSKAITRTDNTNIIVCIYKVSTTFFESHVQFKKAFSLHCQNVRRKGSLCQHAKPFGCSKRKPFLPGLILETLLWMTPKLVVKSRKRFSVEGCFRKNWDQFWSLYTAIKQSPRSYWQCGMCGGDRECTAGGPPCVFVGWQTPAS